MTILSPSDRRAPLAAYPVERQLGAFEVLCRLSLILLLLLLILILLILILLLLIIILILLLIIYIYNMYI